MGFFDDCSKVAGALRFLDDSGLISAGTSPLVVTISTSAVLLVVVVSGVTAAASGNSSPFVVAMSAAPVLLIGAASAASASTSVSTAEDIAITVRQAISRRNFAGRNVVLQDGLRVARPLRCRYCEADVLEQGACMCECGSGSFMNKGIVCWNVTSPSERRAHLLSHAKSHAVNVCAPNLLAANACPPYENRM